MRSYSGVTGTITYAIKGRDLLRRSGFKAHIEKITGSSQNIGCGYTIIVSGDIESAERTLRNAGVKILQINEI